MKRGTHPNHPNHQGCLNSDHCINHNVDDEQYSRSHVSEHCNCDPITINEDHMMEIIEQDGIPLIDCRTMLTDSSSIALVKHDPKMAYAAISHVSFQSLYCCCYLLSLLLLLIVFIWSTLAVVARRVIVGQE